MLSGAAAPDNPGFPTAVRTELDCMAQRRDLRHVSTNCNISRAGWGLGGLEGGEGICATNQCLRHAETKVDPGE